MFGDKNGVLQLLRVARFLPTSGRDDPSRSSNHSAQHLIASGAISGSTSSTVPLSGELVMSGSPDLAVLYVMIAALDHVITTATHRELALPTSEKNIY